ncbi:hypothetical protein Syn7502_00961 [Synechococcus sp. PCC 7502]|uniref:RipA family octameric membrane protein n=1 Tax=Synechococcus sp. PCC 7502 TaxID=1173263 RepID=UPI00029FDCBB|nr:hypothetical protein [Synechococcus sp. PCC 7502]AFY73076.1 hypothetical protein Syn7502_00961 [Synechococcus sp. PCC 7502]
MDFSTLKRLDDQIHMEYDLMGQRMSWMVISQSFLFTAVAASANSSVDHSMRKVIDLLRLLIPSIGILSCLFAIAAIFAARSVINRLKNIRNSLEDALSLEHGEDRFYKLGVRQTEWQHSFGNFPTSFLPLALICVWLIILVAVVWN